MKRLLKVERAPFPSVLACMAAVLLIAACARDSAKGRPTLSPDSDPDSPKPKFGPVSFSHPMAPLGDMMRAFGGAAGGGFVLMSGLEEHAMAAVNYKGASYEQVIADFASAVNATYSHTSNYYLILPQRYEPLMGVSLLDKLDERYREMRVGAVFGAKTSLYVLFSALSKSLDITIVADNYIAESRSGELYLPDLPLATVLEAILQSARIADDAFEVESTPEYIFLRAPQNTGPASVRLETGSPNDASQALLDRQVSLALPANPENKEDVVLVSQPVPLHDALFPLTEQLGVEIVARRQLADIPINPCVINKVRLSTALDLLIRQWPLASFGWEVQADRILIRER